MTTNNSTAHIIVPSTSRVGDNVVAKSAIDTFSHVVAAPDDQRSEADNKAFFRDLRIMLKASIGANKDDRVTILIIACLGEGITNGKRIVGIAKHFDFNPQHAGMMLKRGANAGQWRRSLTGEYALPT